MKIKRLLWLGVLFMGMVACSKDSSTTDKPPIEDNQGDKTVDWSHRANGSVYTTEQAAEDFGGVIGWQDGRAHIIDGLCRVTLLKNSLVAEGGLNPRTVVPSGTEYELSFDVKFDANFDWSRGGKVGAGFRIGDGNTGCRSPKDGEGGSMRIMWYQNDQGKVSFIPYLYYSDMPGSCGDNFNKTYPKERNLELDRWYTVYMHFKSNTAENVDGLAVIKIDDEILLEETIRWTRIESKRKVNGVFFHTFRGGSESYWESKENGYIYFRNIHWKRLKN